MSATELAIVVEGWATVAGLMAVIAGAVFAGVAWRAQRFMLASEASHLSQLPVSHVAIVALKAPRKPEPTRRLSSPTITAANAR